MDSMTLVALSAVLSTLFLSCFVLTAHLVSPFFVRFVTRARPENDPGLVELASNAFRRAGIRMPRIWRISTESQSTMQKPQSPHTPGPNAFVCGLPLGRLQWAGLFITDSLSSTLTEGEMEAVLLHEASHLALQHGIKRAGAAVAFFILSVLGFSVSATLCLLFLPQTLSLIALLVGLIAMIQTQVQGMRWLICRQEFEADRHAVRKLGASPADLVGALRKLEPPTKAGTAHRVTRTHPPSHARIEALERMALTHSQEEQLNTAA